MSLLGMQSSLGLWSLKEKKPYDWCDCPPVTRLFYRTGRYYMGYEACGLCSLSMRGARDEVTRPDNSRSEATRLRTTLVAKLLD